MKTYTVGRSSYTFNIIAPNKSSYLACDTEFKSQNINESKCISCLFFATITFKKVIPNITFLNKQYTSSESNGHFIATYHGLSALQDNVLHINTLKRSPVENYNDVNTCSLNC